MSAGVLGDDVRATFERMRLGEPPSAADTARLREQTRDVDRAIGALIRHASDEDR